MAEEQQPKMPSQSPSGETTSTSKKTKVVLSGSSCPVLSAGVKEEPEQGGVAHAHGGGGSHEEAAAAEQASQALERPRITISVDVSLLHCAVAECHRPPQASRSQGEMSRQPNLGNRWFVCFPSMALD